MSVIPDLVTADDLAGLPGAPFTPAMVRAAQAKVRAACGWHVAPSVTEQLIIAGDGGCEQWLPSRHVSAVQSVEVWDGTGWVDMPGWNQATGWDECGVLAADVPFPSGRRSIRVALTHGFDPVPDDLKLLVAVSTGRQIVSESISSRSMTFSDGDAYGVSAILDRYRVGGRP